MARHKVKRLPVVNAEGMLEGVVSRSDLLKVFLRGDEELAQEVRHEVVDRLFPLSADHIHVEVTEGVVTLTGWVDDDGVAGVARGWPVPSRAWSTSAAAWSRCPRGATHDDGSGHATAPLSRARRRAGNGGVRGRWSPAAHT
ncbi:BON domain-containing protein [Streptomyces sp. NBC_00365]|uniref:CBS domain-containing protein n=1 Tax=Streptomyces sp. NBC_00365 TaxID=2975726 RepID=UPI002B1D55AD|nr:BON domain-containing protein [Streptomyces sp. NBC_00365]